MKKTLLRMVLFVLVSALVFLFGGASILAEGSEPVIVADTLILVVGQEYDLMEGVSVTDDKDLDLVVQTGYNDLDITTPGYYWVEYWVIDSDGFQAILGRQIIVLDEDQPLLFAYDQMAIIGMPFDPMDGVMAYDLKDGDLSDAVVVLESTVDLTREGEYSVTFQVEDSDGFAAELTVLVQVMISEADRPQIQADTLILKVDDVYIPLAGVTAMDKDGTDLSDQVEVVYSSVDTHVPGIYSANFEVTDAAGITGSGGRDVIVLASSEPFIFADDLPIGIGDYSDDFYRGAFRAYDLEDGVITERITFNATQVDSHVAGIYDLTLRVEDTDGNTAEQTIKVTIIDFTYPQLMAEDYQVILGSEFDPLVAVGVYDTNDPDIASKLIVVENTVDTSTLGVYSVTYSVTNSLGHTTVKTVAVEVVLEPVFELFLRYDGESYLLEMDEALQLIFLEVPVTIPAGAHASLAIYIHDIPFWEFPDFTFTNEVLPNTRYIMVMGGGEGEEDDQTVTAVLIPALSESTAERPNAKDARLTFMANVEGTCYFGVAGPDGEIPGIDTSGEGMPIMAGLNELHLADLDQGEWACYVVLKDAYGHLSEPLRIVVPWTPNEPVRPGNKGNHYGHDKIRDTK